MIFISHNHKDKIVIEPIAERLAEIFGRESIFYDSWSIQPGDGIIDKMDEGLKSATHFFFFVSENSIKSNMVKMEWQNAIFKSSQGKCKVIPIRLDETSMPAILAQSLYIDMYSNGIETTITQIVNVIQGNSTYNSSSNKFSNLTYTVTKEDSNKYHVKIFASHFLEPIPEFLIAVENLENELKFNLPKEGSFYGGFNKDIKLNNGKVINAQLMRGGMPITPKNPLLISVETINGSELKFIGVMHKSEEDRYDFIPERR
ncbi:MAG: toll/interleukin-1 receptor domain-containing protein [Bacteroidales bacterium]|jgi:hypothetical protein